MEKATLMFPFIGPVYGISAIVLLLPAFVPLLQLSVKWIIRPEFSNGSLAYVGIVTALGDVAGYGTNSVFAVCLFACATIGRRL